MRRRSQFLARKQAFDLQKRAHSRERYKASEFRKALKRLRDTHLEQMREGTQKSNLAIEKRPLEIYGVAQDMEPLGGYLSLGDAEAALRALERAEDRNRSSSGMATGIAIGLAAVAVLGLGVVVCYLLFRRKEPSQSLAAPPQVFINGMVPAHVVQKPTQALGSPRYHEDPEEEFSYQQVDSRALTARPQHAPMVRTIVLPSIATAGTRAVRIVNATEIPYKAIVRVVSPPGSFAALSFESNELEIPGIVAVPTGDTFLMPAGAQQEFRLAPHQALFGKGSMNDVIISVIASESNG